MSKTSLTPFSADLDDSTVHRLDEHAQSEVVGQQRRMALMMCARDSESLIRAAREEPDGFAQMAQLVMDFEEHSRAVREVAESAFARLAAVRQAVYGDVFDD